MKTYLVGGAVRDRLLGLPPGDRYFVVVGQTPEAMLARGFEGTSRSPYGVAHDCAAHERRLERASSLTEKTVNALS